MPCNPRTVAAHTLAPVKARVLVEVVRDAEIRNRDPGDPGRVPAAPTQLRRSAGPLGRSARAGLAGMPAAHQPVRSRPGLPPRTQPSRARHAPAPRCAQACPGARAWLGADPRARAAPPACSPQRMQRSQRSPRRDRRSADDTRIAGQSGAASDRRRPAPHSARAARPLPGMPGRCLHRPAPAAHQPRPRPPSDRATARHRGLHRAARRSGTGQVHQIPWVAELEIICSHASEQTSRHRRVPCLRSSSDLGAGYARDVWGIWGLGQLPTPHNQSPARSCESQSNAETRVADWCPLPPLASPELPTDARQR